MILSLVWRNVILLSLDVADEGDVWDGSEPLVVGIKIERLPLPQYALLHNSGYLVLVNTAIKFVAVAS